MIQRAWHEKVRSGRDSHIIMRKFNSTTRALKNWNYNHFGIAKRKIKYLEQELETLQTMDAKDLHKQQEVAHELKIQKDRLEMIYKQKSRENCLKEKDRNTQFFHTNIISRRRINEISEI